MSQLPESIKEIIRRELAPQQPCLEGWTSAERGIEMAELVMECNPLIACELGTFGGRSLIAQALALKHLGRGQIYAIDPWRTADALEAEQTPANLDWWSKLDIHNIHRGCMEAIWRLGLEDTAVVIRSASQHCARLFQVNSIGVLMIDGNHSELASCRDVQLYLPRVISEGYIIMDDCDWESTKRAQFMLDGHCKTILTSPDGHYKIYRKR